MRIALTKAWTAALDIFFPPQCAVCGKIRSEARETFLCTDCAETIPLHNTFFCGECHSRLPEGRKICHKSTQYLLAAATNYENPVVRHLLWRFKYRHAPALARPLAALLARYLNVLNLNSDTTQHSNILENVGMFGVVVPVPLSLKRLRERGYNHAEEIARIVANRFNLPLVPALVKAKDTTPQAELKEWSERALNLAECFRVPDPAAVKGRHVLLIDDISTSGATLAEASRMLKAAGAKKIIGLVVAKAG